MIIQANLHTAVGRIKPMHGVGQPPFLGTSFDMFHYLTEAHVPFSRLHDVGGAYGGFRWVDVPNIFRDFHRDPTDPDAYDFAFTDLLITALVESGVEPFFRLGVTIENDAAIRAYRIYPPADNHKWAVVCEHIIRHYTEGWADGFHYPIRYWEIWNEPDNYEEILENQMWRGTKEQYFALYEAASKHLKSCFPHLKIGGYASCGFYAINESFVASANSSPRYEYFMEFFDAFLVYIREHDCPLDFFSWHSYDSIENNRAYAHYARRRLDEAGYSHTETTCNEWNFDVPARGTARHAAVTCGMMLMFQNTPLDSAMFYDAGFSVIPYASLFNPLTAQPFPTYYAFRAFGELYRLGEQAEVILEEDQPDVYAVGAGQGREACLLIANVGGADVPLLLETDGTVKKCLLTSEAGVEVECDLPAILPPNSFLLIYLDV